MFRANFMPYVTLEDVEIYFEIHGPESGQPLLLLEGLGYDSWMWFRQLPEFSKNYKCIVVDNRGGGKSSKPDYPYETSMFAKDAIGVLDYLNIQKVHVLGISLGGFIAQEIALTYPDRIISLIIASASFGGPNAPVASQETVAKILTSPSETVSLEEAYNIRMSVVASKEWLQENKKLLEQIILWREENPQPNNARLNQAHASSTFNVEDKISSIQVPTLIIHGDSDIVVPTRNAELIHEKISNSKLVLIKGGQHWSFIQYYEQFNRAVLDFLDLQST